MKQRHVSFTRTAQRHVAQEKAWWLENRDYPEVFVEELTQALKVIAVLPGAGYARSPIFGRTIETAPSLPARLQRTQKVEHVLLPDVRERVEPSDDGVGL